MNRCKRIVCVSAAALVFAVLMLLYSCLSFAPFGARSLAWMDANIQYLDFFAYLKDVLAGENSILYSFGKVLGGTNIAVFSYYLSSPFNLLLMLFDKANLHSFLDIAVALKLSAAAASFAYFLCVRFQLLGKQRGEYLLAVLLASGYALGHYPIAQSSNVMWLDGVYMLPLILVAVYEVVSGKSGWRLSVFVGLSILFNWYSGGINCMFSIFYMAFELLLAQTKKPLRPVGGMLKDNTQIVVRYGIAMILGVMISAVLFLPTIAALGNSSRGSLELYNLKKWTFFGDPGSILYGLAPGVQSEKGVVSLFCGSLSIVGVVCCFADRRIALRRKVVMLAMGMLVALMFFFNPLVSLFSLLKSCYSYWYRYSYVGIFFLLFLAGYGFFAGSILRSEPYNHLTKGAKGIVWSVILLIACMAELGCGAASLMKTYSAGDVELYESYVLQAQKQIDEIRAIDDGVYRISQTSTRNTGFDRLTANYNEALAFNYASISGYTSSADEIQKQMLDRMGYRINCENMNIVNTSVLAADSLLGVKYVLSEYPIHGLEPVQSIPKLNGKNVYLNPYALPFAYVCSSKGGEIDNPYNPFVYVNRLYSQLLGEETEVYIPLEFGVSQQDNVRNYELRIPQGNYAVYGNIRWQSEMYATLRSGDYRTGYSCWLSPSVFYVPMKSGQEHASVELSASEYFIEDEQFYALDIDLLEKVTNRLRAGSVMDSARIENGHVQIKVQADPGQRLMLSVPHDRGWRIFLNEKPVKPELFAGCMYTIVLEDGLNVIQMKYHTRYLELGACCTGLGLCVAAMMGMRARKKNARTV